MTSIVFTTGISRGYIERKLWVYISTKYNTKYEYSPTEDPVRMSDVIWHKIRLIIGFLFKYPNGKTSLQMSCKNTQQLPILIIVLGVPSCKTTYQYIFLNRCRLVVVVGEKGTTGNFNRQFCPYPSKSKNDVYVTLFLLLKPDTPLSPVTSSFAKNVIMTYRETSNLTVSFIIVILCCFMKNVF